MFTFDLRGKRGILIFTLYNYRKGEGMEYHAGYTTQKRLNSYAFYNIETNDLRIVHYDSIKARVYEGAIAAYTITPGEIIIGLRGSSCYYIDHTGQEVGYAGDKLFYYKDIIDGEITDDSDDQDMDNKIQEDVELFSKEEHSYKIEKNKIIYDNGDIYESKYLLKEKIKNIIICYTIDEKEEHYEKLLYGICDNHGNLLCEIKYDEIWTSYGQIIRDKYFLVKLNGKFGILSFEGKEILPAVYGFIDDCDGNIAVVDHGEKLIKIKDQSVLYETEGRILKNIDGWMRVVSGYYPATTLGFLDSTGKLYEFREKIGLWRQRDKVLYKALGDSLHDGLLPVFSENRGYGYVDIDSNEIIECKYCEISDFENGRAKVRLDCEYGYINTKGCMLVKKNDEEIAIPSKYDWAYNYINGYFIVQQKGLWGAIDEYMNEIIPCSLKTKEDVERTYSMIKLHSNSFSEIDYEKKYKSFLPPIRFEESNLFGFKSAIGELMFPPVLRVGKFVEGMAVIGVCGKYGYINEKLELVIPPQYNDASDFSEGLALVGREFINKLGEYVVSFARLHENLHSFKNGVAKCEYNPCTPGKDNEDDEISKYKIGYKITI